MCPPLFIQRCLFSVRLQLDTSLLHLYNFTLCVPSEGLPWWLSGKESARWFRRLRFDPCIGKISWRRAWQPTPLFLPGEAHGQRSLVGDSPWGLRVRHNRATNTHAHIFMPAEALGSDWWLYPWLVPYQDWDLVICSSFRGVLCVCFSC